VTSNNRFWHAALMKCGAVFACSLTAGPALSLEAAQSGLAPAAASTACKTLMAGASPASGAEAARMIDWDSVGNDSPIPPTMPAASSDDPLEAGFAYQWAERAFKDDKGGLASSLDVCGDDVPCHRGPIPSNVPALPLVLEIISQRRMPGDHWAYGVESELRALIRTKVDTVKPTTVSRVFCNSMGCVCYLERRNLPADSDDGAHGLGNVVLGLVEPAHAAWRRSLGIQSRNIHFSIFGSGARERRTIWELVVITRGPSGDDAAAVRSQPNHQ
jgi:hypothetical protein